MSWKTCAHAAAPTSKRSKYSVCACCSASYAKSGEVFIVDTLERNDFFDEMDKISLELFQEMKKAPALLLLTIGKEFEYEIQFEYENMKRWNISLLDGGSGVPSD